MRCFGTINTSLIERPPNRLLHDSRGNAPHSEETQDRDSMAHQELPVRKIDFRVRRAVDASRPSKMESRWQV